jgi:mannosyltransferase OCH1-like enzyme
MQSWRRVYPEWDYRLWTDSELQSLNREHLICPYAFESEQNAVVQSDVLRMELLWKFGGIYADCDFESLESMEHLFQNECFHYGDEREGRPSNAWMCSTPQHRIPSLVLDQLKHGLNKTIDISKDWEEVVRKTGPEALARALNYWIGERPGKIVFNQGVGVGTFYPKGIVVFWKDILYPYWGGGWEAFSRDRYPLAMAAHHWAGCWK